MVKKKTNKHSQSTQELTARVKELEENWKRALADYKNLEKRVGEERATFVYLANAALIDKMLGVLDDLDRAAQHLKDEGLSLVINRFRQVLQSEGVKEISVEGKEFDPKLMECVSSVPGEKNKVMKVVAKGYILNDHILRPAKVEVGAVEGAPINK